MLPGTGVRFRKAVGDCLLAERIEVEDGGVLGHVLAVAVFHQQRVPPEQWEIKEAHKEARIA